MVLLRRDAAPRVLRPLCPVAAGRAIAITLLLAIAAVAAGCEEPVPDPPIVGFTVAQQACADGSCMLISGRATVEGRPAPAGAPIDAYAGDQPCGSTVAGPDGAYSLRVPGDQSQSACAVPGGQLGFEVYGARAIATTAYQPGASVTLDLNGQGDAPEAPPSAYCFEPSLLPAGFVPQTVRTSPNGRSAEIDVGSDVPAAERPARVAERLQIYARQGRRTGFQWTAADPRFLRALGIDGQGPALDAQARAGVLRTLAAEPFMAAQCIVGLYRSVQGAEAGYSETATTVLNPPPGAGDYRRVDAPDGDTAAATVYRSPEWGGTCVYVGAVRAGTAVGVISVLSPSPAAMRPCTELAGPGRLLMWSMVDRIRALTPAAAPAPTGGPAQATGTPAPAPARPTPSPTQLPPGVVRPSPSIK